MTEQADILDKTMKICLDYDRVRGNKALPHKIYGQNPRLIILGECHADETDASQQREVSRVIQPEFFIHEFLRNNIFDPKKRRVFENPDYSTPAELLEPAMKEYSKTEKKFGCNPNYDWSKKPKQKLNARTYNEWVSNVDFWLNPFACGDFSHSFGSSDGGVERFEANHPSVESYIGCDLSYLERKALERTVSEDEFHAIREIRMGQVIQKHSLKSEKPVVAVVGAHHIRAASGIHSILEKSDISYLVVDLSFDIYGRNQI